jgi:hypothetical protein
MNEIFLLTHKKYHGKIIEKFWIEIIDDEYRECEIRKL